MSHVQCLIGGNFDVGLEPGSLPVRFKDRIHGSREGTQEVIVNAMAANGRGAATGGFAEDRRSRKPKILSTGRVRLYFDSWMPGAVATIEGVEPGLEGVSIGNRSEVRPSAGGRREEQEQICDA